MRAVVVGLLLLSGCDALFNLDHVPSTDGGGRDEGGGDTAFDDAETQNICIGTGRGFHPAFCYPGGTPFPASFSPITPIDTDTMCDEVVTQSGATGICIKKAMTINITVPVRVTGGRPLVLLAVDTIDISGALDASSTRGGSKGAGSNTGETTNGCSFTLSNGSPGGLNAGGGGGAGGTFRGAGGSGGTGDMSLGGQARAAENPAVIRGGCNGGNGGSGGSGTITAGTPGAAGGGSLYIAARTAITVLGAIKVNGAGGAGGASFYGGAGGGAGGMIVLDAPQVILGSSSSLSAVGGGGGQGGASNASGGNGQDGPTATGGTSSDPGGTGGNGAEANAFPGNSGAGAGGGGGGGGGGYIAIFSPMPVTNNGGSSHPSPIVQ